MSDNQDIKRLKEASNISTLNETEKVILKCWCGGTSDEEEAPVGEYKAYGRDVIDWYEAIPQEGSEYRVIAHFPFYGEIGKEFRVVYCNKDWTDVDFTKFYNIVCCRLTGIESIDDSKSKATIRIIVTQVRCLLDFLNCDHLRFPEDSDSHLSWAESCIGDNQIYYYKRIWDQNSCVQIDWQEEDYCGGYLIYTDKNGIDHLLAVFGDGIHISRFIVVDDILGDHEKRKQLIRTRMARSSLHRGALCGSWYEDDLMNNNVIMHYRSSAAYLWIDDLLDYLMCREIGDDALECAAQEVVFERRIPPIGEHAFSRCADLRKVTVLDDCEIHLNQISPKAFEGCSNELVFSVPAGSKLIPLIQKMGFQIQERGLNERTEELLPPRPSLEDEPEDSSDVPEEILGLACMPEDHLSLADEPYFDDMTEKSDVPEEILGLASMPEDHLSLADEPYFDDMAEKIVQHEVKQRKKR